MSTFRPLHQIEAKEDECEKQASLLNLKFNMEDETYFHILNKIIKKLTLIRKIWYGGNGTNRTRCGASDSSLLWFLQQNNVIFSVITITFGYNQNIIMEIL